MTVWTSSKDRSIPRVTMTFHRQSRSIQAGQPVPALQPSFLYSQHAWHHSPVHPSGFWVLTLTCIQHFMWMNKSMFKFTLWCGTSMAWKNPAGSWPIERDIVVQRSPLAPLFSMYGSTRIWTPRDLSLILCPHEGRGGYPSEAHLLKHWDDIFYCCVLQF